MAKRIALCIVLSLALAGATFAREGFGFTKRATEFTKTIPPAVNVSGNKVNVTASSRTRFAEKAETLRKLTEEELTKSNKFQVGTPADANVAIELDRLEVSSHSENKVDYDYEKYKDKDGKTQYRKVPKTSTETVVTGSIAGGYKITDSRGGLLDSGDIDNHFEKRYDYSTTKKEEELQEGFLTVAAQKIASRIAPTTRKSRVLLPKGSFEAYAPLAESGAWDRYLQAVEAVPALSDPSQDAYRQYALGIAKEAVAYSSDDRRRALELLRAAADHYRKAVADNPNEKLFSEGYSSLLDAAAAPLKRAETSIKAYEAWASGPTLAKAEPASMASSKTARQSKALQNQNVIEMARAGVPDENIVLAIDSAEATEFDTSPDGLIALSKGGVSKNVIAHIQKRGKR